MSLKVLDREGLYSVLVGIENNDDLRMLSDGIAVDHLNISNNLAGYFFAVANKEVNKAVIHLRELEALHFDVTPLITYALDHLCEPCVREIVSIRGVLDLRRIFGTVKDFNRENSKLCGDLETNIEEYADILTSMGMVIKDNYFVLFSDDDGIEDIEVIDSDTKDWKV